MNLSNFHAETNTAAIHKAYEFALSNIGFHISAKPIWQVPSVRALGSSLYVECYFVLQDYITSISRMEDTSPTGVAAKKMGNNQFADRRGGLSLNMSFYSDEKSLSTGCRGTHAPYGSTVERI